MDERIKEHLMHLNRYHLLLCDAQKIPYETFMESPIYQASSERFLQLAIESCLNIGNRLISIVQFERPINAPETYADIFKVMQEIGVVDAIFAARLIQMAKFRNRLVHMYWEIDREQLYQFLQENLEDFVLFRKHVMAFINNNLSSS